MVSRTDKAHLIDPDVSVVDEGAMEMDEMEEFFEFGPDPWLAERVRLDSESDEVRHHDIRILVDALES